MMNAMNQTNQTTKPGNPGRHLKLRSWGVTLDEWRTQAYENAKLFKEKVNRWHDKRIQKREFNVGDYVLLYNSRLRFFCKQTSL